MAAAACLLGAFGLLLWFGKPNALQTTLAAALQELRENRPEAALERLEVLVACQSGFFKIRRLAGGSRLAGSPSAPAGKTVFSGAGIEARLTALLGPTARLVNLRIQAQRGMTGEVVLAEAGVLLAYGYEPDGRSWTMALPRIDATMDRLGRELEEACCRFLDEPALWLNWGQFLLSIARPDSAKECFQWVAQIEPHNPLAWTGLGLAAFEQCVHQEGPEYFQRALRLGREDISARLNLAICLYRLGQRSEALEQFQHVLRQTDAPELRVRIQMYIPELQTLEKPRP